MHPEGRANIRIDELMLMVRVSNSPSDKLFPLNTQCRLVRECPSHHKLFKVTAARKTLHALQLQIHISSIFLPLWIRFFAV